MRREDDGRCVAFELMQRAFELDAGAHHGLGRRPEPATVQPGLAEQHEILPRQGLALRRIQRGKAQLEIAQRNPPPRHGHDEQQPPEQRAQRAQPAQRQTPQHAHQPDTEARAHGATCVLAACSTRGCL
ncbi:hypothetical protein D3C71_1842080 [compost metagenome]